MFMFDLFDLFRKRDELKMSLAGIDLSSCNEESQSLYMMETCNGNCLGECSGTCDDTCDSGCEGCGTGA